MLNGRKVSFEAGQAHTLHCCSVLYSSTRLAIRRRELMSHLSDFNMPSFTSRLACYAVGVGVVLAAVVGETQPIGNVSSAHLAACKNPTAQQGTVG